MYVHYVPKNDPFIQRNENQQFKKIGKEFVQENWNGKVVNLSLSSVNSCCATLKGAKQSDFQHYITVISISQLVIHHIIAHTLPKESSFYNSELFKIVTKPLY